MPYKAGLLRDNFAEGSFADLQNALREQATLAESAAYNRRAVAQRGAQYPQELLQIEEYFDNIRDILDALQARLPELDVKSVQ